MRTVIIATSATAALLSSPAFAQQPSGTASIPDFSGVWTHPYLPGYEPPAAGAGPVTNRSRVQSGPQKGVSSIGRWRLTGRHYGITINEINFMCFMPAP